jgi:4-amino-4-deoxy-L-arabinose transferase-like glycosyltransferase
LDAKNNKRSFLANLCKICRNPLFILIAITVGITIYLLNVQIKIGVPYWDVFNYLNNALYFAGIGPRDILYLPPFLPLLTSIFFRMGYVSVNVIFILTSILFVIGVIGLYLLLKERFNSIQSLTACFIFISFPVVMSWAATGGIDLPGASLSIWALYFTVLGVKKDSKFLYLILPITMLVLLTRYTAGLIIVPMLLYLLINIKHVQNLKKIISGVFVEFIVLITIFIYFYMKIGISTSFYSLLVRVTSSSISGVGDVAYNPNTLYFIQNIPNYISIYPFQGPYQHILNPSQGIPSILSYVIALIVLSGLSFYIYRLLNSKEGIDKFWINKAFILKMTMLFVLITTFFTSFNNTPFIISEIIFFGICYLLYRFFKDIVTNIDLDFMFLSWFGTYLIFQSTLGFKVDRYFITMAPALAYFIILGLSEFIDKIKPQIKNSNIKPWGIYLIISLIFLSSAVASNISHQPKKSFTVDIEHASNWLVEHDPGYKNKVIASDYPNAVSWNLKKPVLGKFPRLYNSTEVFSTILQKKGVNYYIDTTSKTHPNIKGYHIIKTFRVVAIYEKN